MYLTNILGQMIFLAQLNQASDSMMNLEMKRLSLSLTSSPSSLHIVNVWYKFNPFLCNRQKKTLSTFLSTYLSLFLSLFCFECESAEIDCFVWRLTPPGNKIHFFYLFLIYFLFCVLLVILILDNIQMFNYQLTVQDICVHHTTWYCFEFKIYV